MPVVIQRRCPGDHPCPVVSLCPAGAVSQEGLAAPEIDPSLCTECGLCVETCPRGAFSSAVRTGRAI